MSFRGHLRSLAPPPEEKVSGARGQSWTDYLDSASLYPGRSLLRYWLSAFSLRAARSIASLVVCCVAAGRNLKQISEVWGPWCGKVRPQNASLALALSLAALLFPASSAESLLDRLLIFLLGP